MSAPDWGAQRLTWRRPGIVWPRFIGACPASVGPVTGLGVKAKSRAGGALGVLALAYLWAGFSPALAKSGATSSTVAAAGATGTTGWPKLGKASGRGQKLLIVPIHGTIDLGIAPFIERAVERNPSADVVIFDVNTFGGRVDAAVRIRDYILELSRGGRRTIAFVHRRAISAGALISYAADHLVFAPGGTMGAATPIQIQNGKAEAVGEKMVSYMRSEMRATAEAKNRRGDIAEAMVDADVEVKGISEKGKLLTLTTETAKTHGVAQGVAESLDDLIARIDMSHAERIAPEQNWAEDLARFLTDPAVSGLLMSIGFLALMMELYSPGFGIPGALGIVLIGLFFGGHMLVGLAGFEEVLLALAGLIALGLEVFVIPGFGIAGVAGIAMLLVALTMSLSGFSLPTAWRVGTFAPVLGRVLLSIGGSFVLLLVVMRKLPNSPFGRWMVLETSLGRTATRSVEEPDEYRSQPKAWQALVGRAGAAETDLRPSGKALLDGKVFDVVSQHEYLERGTPVRVVEVEGARIVVVRGS